VVASVNGFPYVGRCLDSLRRNAPNAEVVVADWTDEETRARIREGWPEVKLLSFQEPTPVPVLRAAGMRAASAPYVAVIEDHCVVREKWGERIVAAHRAGHPVVGGSIRNGETGRIRDWAAFFCEYTEHMEPAPFGTVESLPGMNVSYDRDAIAAMDGFLQRGLWETWLHPHLQQAGFELYSDPEIALDHVKDFGFREFLSQRYHYARSYAGARFARAGALKRAVGGLAAVALPPVLLYRILSRVLSKGQHRRELVKSLPLLGVFVCAWAAGEVVGAWAGDGGALAKVC